MTMQIHQSQPIITAGKPLEGASAAMILIHGRGASARSILELAQALNQPGWAYLAPQAAGSTWYPNRFIAPLESNEPHLSSALQRVGEVLKQVQDAGIPSERIIMLGFSQGACLAVEYSARNAKRYGGVAILSGGLIGPPGLDFNYDGSLDGTPVFIGCSDVDFHIPLERVKETSAVMTRLGADVDERIYPGMGHTVNEDELQAVAKMMAAIVSEE